MIPSIIIIALAFIWLGWETNWLTIRLLACSPNLPDLLCEDYELDYIPLDADTLEAIDTRCSEDFSAWQYQHDYNDWLAQRYTPSYSRKAYKSMEDRRRDREAYRDSELFKINTGMNRYNAGDALRDNYVPGGAR